MKVLLLTPIIPYPLSEGGKVSQYAIIDALRKCCSIILCLVVYSKKQEEIADALQENWPDVDIRKIIMYQPDIKPGLKQRIANKARVALKKLLQAHRVKTAAKIPETEDPYFIHFFQPKQRRLVEKITALIVAIQPDIVQVDFTDFIDLVAVIPAGIKKILVHHELRFVRLLSFFNDNKVTMYPYDEYIIESVKKQEMAFLRAYDGIIVFSDDDKQKLEGINKPVYVSPFPVLEESFQPVTEENAAIKKLVFIGGDNHSPNIDAVEWYVNEIAQAIKRVEPMPLHIIGNWGAAIKNKYKDNAAVHFAGFVEDLAGGTCSNSIMLVPVRVGSGIRTKILYAMAQGVPVISTTLGCEGIKVKDKESILIANTPAAFADAFKNMLANKDYMLSIAQSAQAIARRCYSQQAAADIRLQCLNNVLLN